MRRKLAAGLLLLVALAGCGRLHGEVVEKDLQPAYTTWSHSCHRTGGVQHCSVTPWRHPKCREITVMQKNGKEKSDCVGAKTFRDLEVGDYYDSDPEKKP